MEADCRSLMLASMIEILVGNGFKFKGPGWYSHPRTKGMLLILSHSRPTESLWDSAYEPDETFVLYYYSFDFRERLNQIARAPERIYDGT